MTPESDLSSNSQLTSPLTDREKYLLARREFFSVSLLALGAAELCVIYDPYLLWTLIQKITDQTAERPVVSDIPKAKVNKSLEILSELSPLEVLEKFGGYTDTRYSFINLLYTSPTTQKIFVSFGDHGDFIHSIMPTPLPVPPDIRDFAIDSFPSLFEFSKNYFPFQQEAINIVRSQIGKSDEIVMMTDPNAPSFNLLRKRIENFAQFFLKWLPTSQAQFSYYGVDRSQTDQISFTGWNNADQNKTIEAFHNYSLLAFSTLYASLHHSEKMKELRKGNVQKSSRRKFFKDFLALTAGTLAGWGALNGTSDAVEAIQANAQTWKGIPLAGSRTPEGYLALIEWVIDQPGLPEWYVDTLWRNLVAVYKILYLIESGKVTDSLMSAWGYGHFEQFGLYATDSLTLLNYIDRFLVRYAHIAKKIIDGAPEAIYTISKWDFENGQNGVALQGMTLLLLPDLFKVLEKYALT